MIAQKSIIGTDVESATASTAPRADERVVADSPLSARSLNDVATTLRSIIATGDSVPWAVGEAVEIAMDANSSLTEFENFESLRKRLRAMCKALSAETGIGTNTLIERRDVFISYPKIYRDEYPGLSYSVFREAWRHIENEMERYKWLGAAQDHGWRATELRDAIRLSRGEVVKPKPVAQSFECKFEGWDASFPDLFSFAFSEMDAQILRDHASKPGVAFTLVATIPVAPTTEAADHE